MLEVYNVPKGTLTVAAFFGYPCLVPTGQGCSAVIMFLLSPLAQRVPSSIMPQRDIILVEQLAQAIVCAFRYKTNLTNLIR
ncbi:hypothetical protein AWW68_14475 [Roseivirga spongicola]|uniref:Uncharacterized protein n=1 Tax=Roseivirga spongicola TaxID=333140 RepID=A0A150X5A1_9BACT|nr:hypothetical protein AWW68_14475 [Roseivirga spongicola]